MVGLTVNLENKVALESNVNQGIGSAIITTFTIPASIACWILFGEKLSLLQWTGIVISISGVVILGVSKPQVFSVNLEHEVNSPR